MWRFPENAPHENSMVERLPVKEVPYRLRYCASVAAVIGPIATAIVAIAAITTALVASRTADMAAREFALASRPIVFLTDVTPTLEEKFNGSGTVLRVVGSFRELRGIPTTVHTVRSGHYFQWEATSEARWRDAWPGDFPLHGDRLTRPLLLGLVDTEHMETHIAQNQRLRLGLPFVSFNIVYTVSIQGGPQEEWSVGVRIFCDEHGNCSAKQHTPEIRPTSVE